MRKSKGESTFDQEMKNPAFRAAFEKEYAALEVSEFLASTTAIIRPFGNRQAVRGDQAASR
jgi:hypothetical protein